MEKFAIALERGDESGMTYSWEEFAKNDRGFPTIVSVEGSPRVFLNYLEKVLLGFNHHRFMVKHQEEEFDRLKRNLPKNAVLMLRDYAEKLTLRPKDETQR